MIQARHRNTCFIVLYIVFGTLLFSWLFPMLPQCYAELSDTLSDQTVHIMLVVIILSIGFAFHLLHQVNLILYAITEISFSVASSWHAVDYLMHNEGLISSVPALAAMYIFVRGMANLQEARKPGSIKTKHIGGVS